VIDWTRLAQAVGALTEQGERGSSELARLALVHLLGEQAIRDAVDHYIAAEPGFELVRSVLWLLRPWSAMCYCHALYQDAQDLEVRRSAVELLRVVADARALPWVEAFLADEDQAIQCWGFGVVDTLLFQDLIEPEAAETFLVRAEVHANPGVREQAAAVRATLARRLQVAAG